MDKIDSRPLNCRFRLQDEGKPHPRSNCNYCGKGIMNGLGTSCTAFVGAPDGEPPKPPLVSGFTTIEFPPEAGRVVAAVPYKGKIVVLCEYAAFVTNDFDRNEDMTLHRVTFSVDQLADPQA